MMQLINESEAEQSESEQVGENPDVNLSQLIRATQSAPEPHSIMGQFQGVSQQIMDPVTSSTYQQYVSTIFNGKALTNDTMRALESLNADQSQVIRFYTLNRQDTNGWMCKVFCMWDYMLKSKGEWPAHQFGKHRDAFLSKVYARSYTTLKSKSDKTKPKLKYAKYSQADRKRDLGMAKLMAVIWREPMVRLHDFTD